MHNHLNILKNETDKNNQIKINPPDSSEVIKQAANGNIALHKNSSLGLLLYKLDDPAIIGNLREDGGTLLDDLAERKMKNFQFYTILSCTLLPPTKYPISQGLYEYSNDIFVGFDIRHAVIKNFCLGDGWAEYKNNKHNRPSYKLLISTDYFFLTKPQNRNEKLKQLNDQSAEACTLQKSKSTFSRKPNFIRGMNELLIKINLFSMACIGTTTGDLLNEPAIFLKLVLVQQDIKKRIGINYPIMIYNNDKEIHKIDFLDSKEIEIQPNQFLNIDVLSALKSMSLKFQNKLWSASNKREFIISDVEMTYLNQKLISNEEYIDKLAQGLQLLSDVLPAYTDEDDLICIHKHGASDVHQNQKYLEMNQINLKHFIQKKVLDESHSPEDVMKMCKAYNLQFRLSLYSHLLENKSFVNFGNIDQDLHWLPKVLDNLSTLHLCNRPDPLRPCFFSNK